MPRSKERIRRALLPLRIRGTRKHEGGALFDATDSPVRDVGALIDRSASLASEPRVDGNVISGGDQWRGRATSTVRVMEELPKEFW